MGAERKKERVSDKMQAEEDEMQENLIAENNSAPHTAADCQNAPRSCSPTSKSAIPANSRPCRVRL